MIKVIVLLRRHPGLTREQFSSHWKGVHASLVKSVPESTLHMRRYVQNHMMGNLNVKAGDDAANTMGGLALPPEAMDFDGIVEMWYESMEALREATDNSRYLDVIRPDELRFLDVERCVMYLTEELVVFDENHRPQGEAHGTEEH